jgi:hypothetical protein
MHPSKQIPILGRERKRSPCFGGEFYSSNFNFENGRSFWCPFLATQNERSTASRKHGRQRRTIIYHLIGNDRPNSRSQRVWGVYGKVCPTWYIFLHFTCLAMLTPPRPHSSRAAKVLMTQLPEIRSFFLNAAELVFIPKQIARQFVLAVALKTSMVRSSCESLWIASASGQA